MSLLRVRLGSDELENAHGVTIQGHRRHLSNILQWTNFPYVRGLRRRRLPGHLKTGGGGKSAKVDRKSVLDEGKLASVACSLLMKVLWAARLARPDLLRAVNHLARKVSKWTSTRDSMMSRLMGYTQATLHLRMIGLIGDSRDHFFLHFFADAKFAGDVDTQRSTSGFYSVIRGPNSSFPLSAGSKRQTCVFRLTPEAELVAADFGLRTDVLPYLSLW